MSSDDRRPFGRRWITVVLLLNFVVTGASMPVGASAFGANALSSAPAILTNVTVTSVSCAPQVIGVGESTRCTAIVTDGTPGAATIPSGIVSSTSVGGSGGFNPESCTTGSGSVDPITGVASASCAAIYTSTALGLGARTSSATVSGTDAGTAITPTGTVSFSKSGGSGTFTPGSCSLSGAGASASWSVTYTPSGGTGLHTITASYGGDADHKGSDGSTTIM